MNQRGGTNTHSESSEAFTVVTVGYGRDAAMLVDMNRLVVRVICACRRVCFTLMTGARCTWVCICWAAAAMLAMVFRWFICDIAMATEAGGSPMGSRGCGIIMKGRSSPEEGGGR